MHLTVRHVTRCIYDPDAIGIALRLKLFPAASGAQQPGPWTVAVNGKVVEPLLTDAAGDRIGLWHAGTPSSEVEIVAEGHVQTTDTTGVLRGVREAMPPAVYLRETELTTPSPAVGALANKLNEKIDGDDVLTRLHVLSEAVAEAVAYKPGATDSRTTAAEAILLAEGVCQDQAHVFIAAARHLGIPARYVAGYLLDGGGDGDEENGEADAREPDAAISDQTHAWAEAHVAGLGWVGFDITHQLCPTDAYVRLSSGFDADDAAPIRGTFTGDIEQTLTSTVHVARAASQSQSQQ